MINAVNLEFGIYMLKIDSSFLVYNWQGRKLNFLKICYNFKFINDIVVEEGKIIIYQGMIRKYVLMKIC